MSIGFLTSPQREQGTSLLALRTGQEGGGSTVRRQLIQIVLPLVFCLVPALAAVLIVVALPAPARNFYLDRLTSLDGLILGLGGSLFVVQMMLAWSALQWRGSNFDERPDHWLSHLAQAAEWFPLLGLIGTVAGILQTFSSIKGPTPPATIIQLYAPAITATGSGLFMALINILPSWVVLLGRDIIRSLGGDAPPVDEYSISNHRGTETQREDKVNR
ncbi:MAG TPA: MotA/TolQ/ExbB proton channel family protein [Gemmataceae bacterium]|nr:MotA/TolQ/ExbB proton channel family protein [Gemmataceae bacterium]